MNHPLPVVLGVIVASFSTCPSAQPPAGKLAVSRAFFAAVGNGSTSDAMALVASDAFTYHCRLFDGGAPVSLDRGRFESALRELTEHGVVEVETGRISERKGGIEVPLAGKVEFRLDPKPMYRGRLTVEGRWLVRVDEHDRILRIDERVSSCGERCDSRTTRASLCLAPFLAWGAKLAREQSDAKTRSPVPGAVPYVDEATGSTLFWVKTQDPTGLPADGGDDFGSFEMTVFDLTGRRVGNFEAE